MAGKENKGGVLTPDQIEEDLQAKGKPTESHAYSGSQDTGDGTVKQLGTEVQQRDGRPGDEISGNKIE